MWLTPGVGLGWRPELTEFLGALPELGFVEVIAETLHSQGVPTELRDLMAGGAAVVPHGVKLSVGSANRPDKRRLKFLSQTATMLKAPLVSEHVAFVRAGKAHSPHFLPVPFTKDALKIVAANVREVMAELAVPLALENIATFTYWPEDELTEAEFLLELVEQTGVYLLLDVANLYANQFNLGRCAITALDTLPLEQVAYIHIAGGVIGSGGFYFDSHAHPIQEEVFQLLAELCSRVDAPSVLLERDDKFSTQFELHSEVARLRTIVGTQS
jgi:uncharacterized protein (UPF0276 family)